MSFFKADFCRLISPLGTVVVAITALTACTVEPLNSSRPSSQLDGGQINVSTKNVLASTSVSSQGSRVGQQVRNNLLFAMNGGRLQPGGAYRIVLKVTSNDRKLLIGRDSLAPTAAQVVVNAEFQLIEVRTGRQISTDKKRALAGFDRTPQSFANERALRDAENRAARELAQYIRLSVAQTIAGR